MAIALQRAASPNRFYQSRFHDPDKSRPKTNYYVDLRTGVLTLLSSALRTVSDSAITHGVPADQILYDLKNRKLPIYGSLKHLVTLHAKQDRTVIVEFCLFYPLGTIPIMSYHVYTMISKSISVTYFDEVQSWYFMLDGGPDILELYVLDGTSDHLRTIARPIHLDHASSLGGTSPTDAATQAYDSSSISSNILRDMFQDPARSYRFEPTEYITATAMTGYFRTGRSFAQAYRCQSGRALPSGEIRPTVEAVCSLLFWQTMYIMTSFGRLIQLKFENHKFSVDWLHMQLIRTKSMGLLLALKNGISPAVIAHALNSRIVVSFGLES